MIPVNVDFFSNWLSSFIIGVDCYVHIVYTHCCFSSSFWCPDISVCCYCSFIFLYRLGNHSSVVRNRQCKFLFVLLIWVFFTFLFCLFHSSWMSSRLAFCTILLSISICFSKIRMFVSKFVPTMYGEVALQVLIDYFNKPANRIAHC